MVSGEIPKALQDMPELRPHQGYYLEVYQTLKKWRGYTSEGYPAPLTLADMAHYFWIYGIPQGVAREDLLFHMKTLEIADFNHENKKQSEKVDKGEKSEEI